jgi:hypothetical protein
VQLKTRCLLVFVISLLWLLSYAAAQRVNDGVRVNGVQTGGSGIVGAVTSLLAPNLLISSTAPSLTSGWGAGAAITANGTGGMRIVIGTAPGPPSILTFPAATTGWFCQFASLTDSLAPRSYVTVQSAFTQTTATMTHLDIVAAVVTPFTVGDILVGGCHGF